MLKYLDIQVRELILQSHGIAERLHAVSPVGPLQMLDLHSEAVMLKYTDIQVGEMILQSHGTAADAGPPLRGCHARVFRHTGRRNDPPVPWDRC